MKLAEIATLNLKKIESAGPFLVQKVINGTKPKTKCNCKICGEPLDIGEIARIEAVMGFGKPITVSFFCERDVKQFIDLLITHYDWSPKGSIALSDFGPDGEIVQEFRGELVHCL
ncbi:hypothetical protein AAGG74_17500 [Bacillus mexicanus]|uniref:hypothetical protein n=1 Tax=Bacillus mexicanus TaxID=2834415 RepID=UPI003D1CBD8A